MRGAQKSTDTNPNETELTASTEPRHGGRGNPLPVGPVIASLMASTEPRHGGRGNLLTRTQRLFNQSASTEPRHGGRGNYDNLGFYRCKSWLQRSRATGGAEMSWAHAAGPITLGSCLEYER